jgi:acetylornithine deacetylase
MDLKDYINLATETLKKLISTQSYSGDEEKVADIINAVLTERGYKTHRKKNNVWAYSKNYQEGRPTLLMNSHLDTVKANSKWTKNPFEPLVEDGKLFGLGSNDAGGCLVSLMASFLVLDVENQSYNLVFVASAEEENSGFDGFECVQPELGKIDVGIVGEPTLMDMAIAEKGLMVVDAEAEGKLGHAARDEGINAISIAMEDINWLHSYKFEKESEKLGAVKMTVTQIEAGKQHNVVPASCKFVIDVRTNEHYDNEAAFNIIQKHVKSKLKARSFRLNSSGIELEHPMIQAGLKLGMNWYGSPTTSDQAIMRGFPTVKLGPGDSARSHTADEFIYLEEIKNGIEKYYQLLNGLNF